MAKTFQELCELTFGEIKEMEEMHGDPNIDEFARWVVAQEIMELDSKYKETQDPNIIPRVVFLCAREGFIIPDWAAKLYRAAFLKVKYYGARSWDDVFGKPHPKGTNIVAKQDFLMKRMTVYNRIKEIRESEPGTPIDGALFLRVGLELGIGGKTKVEEYYYSWKRELEETFPD